MKPTSANLSISSVRFALYIKLVLVTYKSLTGGEKFGIGLSLV